MNFSGYLIYENSCLCIYPLHHNLSLYESTDIPHIVIPNEIATRLNIYKLISKERVYFSGEEDSLLAYLDVIDLIKSPNNPYLIRLELLLRQFFQIIHLASATNTFSIQLKTEIDDYISSNLNNSMKIPMLAKRFGLNQQYFKVKFKNTFNLPVHDYIKNKRLDHALLMINSQRYTMSEIANSIGYSTISSFSQAFKLKFGKSPMKYKISKN